MATAIETVSVPLVCDCGDPWIYEKPKGKRGQNPRTNPAHPQCKTKRDNRKRASRRAQARAEGVSEAERSREGWKLPKPSGITEREREALQGATEGLIEWKSARGNDAYSEDPDGFDEDEVLSVRELLNHQGVDGRACMDDYADRTSNDWERFRYFPKEKQAEVKAWLSAHEMPSQEYTGIPGPSGAEVSKGQWSKHVIGSMKPWYLANLPRMGSVQPLARMEPFTMIL